MENLSDFITTKYNIILFDLKQKKLKSAQTGALGGSMQGTGDTGTGTSNSSNN